MVCYKKFGPAQNILGPEKGQGIKEIKIEVDVVPWTKNNNLTLWFLQCFHLEVLVLEVVVVLVVREGPLGLTTYLVR